MKLSLLRIVLLFLCLTSLVKISTKISLAQSCTATVGYYDMEEEGADPDQLAPIITVGRTPVALSNVTAGDLAALDVLFVQNQRSSDFGPEYLANQSAIQNAVQNGMVLLMHDRIVTGAAAVLPGASSIQFITTTTTNIEIVNNTTRVTNGPGGTVTATTLDSGNPSARGYALLASLPFGAVPILSTNIATQIVAFAYPYGDGWVIYSTIPLGFYLDFPALYPNFNNIYGPNVLEYAAFMSCHPTISMATQNVNLHGQSKLSVPITFTTGGVGISSLSFTNNYDQSCLSFDATTDSNNDGIPDAITGLPSGFATTIQHSPGNGRLRFLISPPLITPLPVLSSGIIATATFGLQNSCITTNGVTRTVSFAFSQYRFGNYLGRRVFGEVVDGAYTLRFNANPTDIQLSNSALNENLPAATVVGNLTSSDLDSALGDQHTYSLVAGVGSADNGFFTISSNQLKVATAFNSESKKSYAIRIRTTDLYGGTYEEAFTINVLDVNEAPTNLLLSNNSIAEHVAVGTAIGALSTSDKDMADDATGSPGIIESHSYILPAGLLDNNLFSISGSLLQINTNTNYEAKNTYNVQLRTTDTNNQSFDKVVTIVINNVNDAPVANDDPTVPTLLVLGNGTAITIGVLANDTDEDHNPLVVNSVSAATFGSTQNGTQYITYTATQNVNGADSFTYSASDGALSDAATVSLYVVANDQRADCNADSEIDAADFAALVLEIFDTDVSLAWWRIHEQGFAGSPRGCDANGSENGFAGDQESVQVSDLICATRLFFGETCTSLAVMAAAESNTPTLAVASGLAAAAGTTVAVPIRLTTFNQPVAAATFALDFDPAHLSFDPTDNNGDGLPDAVQLALPAGVESAVRYNVSESRVEIAIYSMNLPMPLLTEGEIATISLQINSAIPVTETTLTLTKASLGNEAGSSVPLVATGATLTIGSSAPDGAGPGDGSTPAATKPAVSYLPLVHR